MFTTRLKNIRKRLRKLEKNQEKENILIVQILRLFLELIEAVEEQKSAKQKNHARR